MSLKHKPVNAEPIRTVPCNNEILERGRDRYRFGINPSMQKSYITGTYLLNIRYHGTTDGMKAARHIRVEDCRGSEKVIFVRAEIKCIVEGVARG